jgi:hypothetical protein
MLASLLTAGATYSGITPVRPNPVLTPGVTNPTETTGRICKRGHTRYIRHVTVEEKAKVFAEYGLDKHTDRFEIDHLIPLELGGSNNIRNLWPQSYTTQPWNARKKDALENRLHRLVCAGKIPLNKAQKEISEDWIKAYKRYFSSNSSN